MHLECERTIVVSPLVADVEAGIRRRAGNSGARDQHLRTVGLPFDRNRDDALLEPVEACIAPHLFHRTLTLQTGVPIVLGRRTPGIHARRSDNGATQPTQPAASVELPGGDSVPAVDAVDARGWGIGRNRRGTGDGDLAGGDAVAASRPLGVACSSEPRR